MMRYLDTVNNRKGQPNENFAREVMELFTLGEGHYSEQDIREAARAFTGWSLDKDFQFVYRPNLHDNGDKTIFGQQGNFDGDDVLDMLLRKPQTARFVTLKLWKYLVSPPRTKPTSSACPPCSTATITKSARCCVPCCSPPPSGAARASW
jgi:uncharacterized protein (DUF1800 family)